MPHPKSRPHRLKTPTGGGYASSEDAAAEQGAGDAVDNEAAGSNSEAAATNDASTQSDDAAATSVQASGNNAAQGAVAVQSSNYNPDADPIYLGSGSESTIDAGVYRDKDRTEPLGDTPAAANDTFYGRVSIEFKGSERPTAEHPNIAYKLPSNIKVADQGPNNLYDENVLAGTWSIKNGVVYLNYREDYLKKKVDTAHFDFDFTIKDQNKGDGDSTKINFPGTASEVTIKHEDGGVSGSKWSSYGDYNEADQTYTWTIEAKVSTVANNLVITDTVGSNLSFVPGSFELVDTKGSKVDGTCNVKVDGQVATISLGKVDAGTYRVRYKTKISESALKKLKDNEALSDVDNDMSWTWGTDGENNGHTTSKPQKELKYSMVSKSAASDSTADRIKWTVVLNSGSLKADMGGYIFTDTLDGNQRYLSDGFTVVDSKGNTVLTGATDPTESDFTLTLPDNAGEEQYTVTYYTELKDASYKKKVTNTAEIETPDPSQGPSGTTSGSVGPFDNDHYISKKLADGSKVDKDGTATWTATIDFKAMSSDTKPGSILFSDSFQNPTPDCDQMRFDAGSVKITYGDTELEKGTDYVINSPNQYWQGNKLEISFRDTPVVRDLIGKADSVKVTYKTEAPSTAVGTYVNKATISADTISKNNTASASYDIKEGSNVKKSGSDAYWDANYAWSDGTKGAWISSWEIAVNRTGSDQNSWKGNSDLLGQDVVIDDELPTGCEVVSGSARYWLMTDGYHSEDGKWEQPITPAVSDGHAKFVVSTSDVATDRHWTGWVKLTYKTAVKDSGLAAGEEEKITNKASASCGKLAFNEGAATSTIKKNVLEKWGTQNSNDAAVTYTIKVNQGKFNIDAESDTLTLVDTMDANCNFVSGSLKVIDSETQKEVTEGVSYTLENVATNSGVATRLTLKVPDQRALTVTYSVMPVGSKGDWPKLKNECELSGFSKAGVLSDKEFEVRNSSAGTHSNSFGITLTKYDQTGKNLAGAVFDLYRVDLDASATGHLTATKIAQETSDANGTVTFGTEKDALLDNTLYYFVESTPPSGYEITFKDPTYVMVKGSDANDYATALKKAKELGITPSASRSFNIYDNEKQEQPENETVSIPVEKKWVGHTGDKAEFQLVADGKDVEGKTLTLTAGNLWKGSFSDLRKVDDEGHEIKYTVKEINVPDGYTSKSTKKDDGTWVFTNTYSVSGNVTVDLTAKKKLTGEGAELKADEFFFQLKDANEDKVLQAKSNDAAGNVSFDTLTFDKVGTYNYTISEVAPKGGVKDGVTYDQSVYNVVVKVEDNDKGGLKVSKTIKKDGATVSDVTFNNTYQKTKSIDVSLSAKKTIDGQTPSDTQKFSFDLNKSDANGTPGGLVDTVQNKGSEVSFKKLTYSDAVDEWYTITEQQPNAKDGFEYDSKTVKVHVVVTKGNDNQLSAKVTYFDGNHKSNEPVTFENEVAPVSTTLKVKKLVNGGSKIAANKEFSFSLYEAGDKDEPKGDAIDTVTVKPGETAAFSKSLSFKKAGTYQYVIVETGNLGDGWTKAGAVTATVTVVAAENGALSVKSVTYSKSDKDSKGNTVALFDNTYEAVGSATVAVQKTVNGETPAADAKFDFELTPLDGAPMPDGAKSFAATTKGGKPTSFADLAYTLKDAGKTYRYLIHETSEATEGWTNAGDVIAEVTVGADQGNGKLGAATVKYVSAADEKASAANADGTAALFDNTFKKVEAEGLFQLSLVKKVNKEVPLTGEKFEFSATAEGDDADTAPVLANVKTDAEGAATFKPAKLSSKNAGKTYTYRIHEVSSLTSGNGSWNKADDVIATVAVSEHADKDGRLDARVTYRKDAESASSYEGAAQFNNTFTPAAVTAPIKVKKVSVNGKTDFKANETYTFGLYKKGSDGQPEGEAIAIVSGKLGKELSFASDKLTFDKADTYEYLVREETHNGSEGWADVADVPVTVTVKAKDGNGSDARDLTAAVKYGDSDKAEYASFADTYTATGSATLAVNKVVNGGADKAKGESFDFALKDAKGNELSRTTAAAGETAEFAPIEYSLADAGKTFTYTISETGHNSGRWFKAGDVTATVKVIDSGNGELKTEVKYSNAVENGTAALFDNTHATPATAELKVSKTVNGSKEDGAKEKFAFELAAKDGAPMPASSELTITGTGTGSFGEISYEKAGTYEYTIHETSDLGAGWKNAKDVTATVTVERDEAAKTLKVTKVEYSNATEDQSAAAFDNTYAAKGAEASLKATKVLKGAELKADQFEFQLKDAKGKVLQTVKNDEDGSVSFDPISYEVSDLDGRGTSRDFEYTISEVVPDGAVDGVKDGVTYDATEHKVKVRVSDDGVSGQLEATVIYDGKSEPPVFTNTYKPKEETPHEDTPKGDTPKGGKSSGKTVLDVFGMPATGDNTTLFVTVIATAGLCALASGLRLARRKRD